jgi:hypothetical protein
MEVQAESAIGSRPQTNLTGAEGSLREGQEVMISVASVYNKPRFYDPS